MTLYRTWYQFKALVGPGFHQQASRNTFPPDLVAGAEMNRSSVSKTGQKAYTVDVDRLWEGVEVQRRDRTLSGRGLVDLQRSD